MRKTVISIVLVLCLSFLLVSPVAYAGKSSNPVKQFVNGVAAIATSPWQIVRSLGKNVDNHGAVGVIYAVVEGPANTAVQAVSGAADVVMPLGDQLSDGCAFSDE